MGINPPLSSGELGTFRLGIKIAVFKFLRVFFHYYFTQALVHVQALAQNVVLIR